MKPLPMTFSPERESSKNHQPGSWSNLIVIFMPTSCILMLGSTERLAVSAVHVPLQIRIILCSDNKYHLAPKP